MNAFANAFLLCYAGLFPIINPVGNIPLFLSLTRSRTKGERNALARLDHLLEIAAVEPLAHQGGARGVREDGLEQPQVAATEAAPRNLAAGAQHGPSASHQR